MSPTQIAVVFIVTMLGSVAHASTGIGIGLIAGPALAAIDPQFLPGPLLVASSIVGLRHVIAEGRHADRGTLGRGLLGMPVGIVAAIAMLEMLSRRSLAIVVGGLTVMAALMLLRGMHFVRTRRTEVIAGALCAFGSLTAALPGPPLVCVYSDMPPRQLRPNAAALILAVIAIGFVSLLATGNFGSRELELLVWVVPGAVAGMLVARFVRPLVDDRPWFRTVILVLALLGGLALVIRQFI